MAFQSTHWESVAFIALCLSLLVSPSLLFFYSSLIVCQTVCLPALSSPRNRIQEEPKSSDNHSSSSIRHHHLFGAFILRFFFFFLFSCGSSRMGFLRRQFLFFLVTETSKLLSCPRLTSAVPHFICAFLPHPCSRAERRNNQTQKKSWYELLKAIGTFLPSALVHEHKLIFQIVSLALSAKPSFS